MRIRFGLSLGLLAVLVASTAVAVQPPDNPIPAAEVPLPTRFLDRALDPEVQSRLTRDDAGLREMNRKYGRWTVAAWNEATGAPGRAFGVPIALVDGSVNEQSIVDASWRFINENPEFVKVDAASLELVNALQRGKHWYVHFSQMYQGFYVYNSDLFLRFDLKGNLIGLGAEIYPDVAVAPWPAISESQAMSVSKSGLPFTEGVDSAELEGLVVMPVPWESSVGFFLTYKIDLKMADGEIGYRAYVDAATGEILWRHPTVYHVNIEGEVNGSLFWEDPNEPPVELPFPSETVAKMSGGSDYTDDAGYFNINNSGSGDETLETSFAGQYFRVNNLQYPQGEISQVVTPGDYVELYWDDTNSNMEDRVPFQHLNVFRNHLKNDIDPGFSFGVTFVWIYANRSGQTCNAYWNGSSVNFYRAGGGCRDMSEMASVAIHEYNHGIADWMYYPVSIGCAMIEGHPDIRAMFHTGIPTVGTGYLIANPDSYIRTGNNTKTWQQALDGCPTGGYNNGECHCKADVSMGAAWKMRVRLIEKLGEEAGALHAETINHYAFYGKPQYPIYYLDDLLHEDDDDGNLDNGSPNWSQICEAFAIHGLDCPAVTEYVTITHTPLGHTIDEVNPYTVVADITATGDVVDTNDLWVHYNVTDAGWNSVQMTATGNPDEFSADIPAQDLGNYIDYYISASGVGGAQATHPPEAPYFGTHLFAVGSLELVLEDDVESDQGWTLNNGDTATDGLWVRDDPIGSEEDGEPANPEDDNTPAPGVNCFFTGQGTEGWPAYLDDVDGGCTYLETPTMDFSGAIYAEVSVMRWWYDSADSPHDALTMEASNNGGADWVFVDEVTGMQNSWTESVLRLKHAEIPLTSQMRLRFVACDLGEGGTIEAAIDDITFSVLTADIPTDVASSNVPATFTVHQNSPNPFNPITSIQYEVPSTGPVSIRVFNVTGQLIRTLVDERVEAGTHSVRWDGRDDVGMSVASGLYYYKVNAGTHESVHKMTLLK